MIELAIHTIAVATWTRFGKWRVELEIVGEPKRVCWLTETQHEYLISAFSHTRSNYSDSSCTVYGLFDEAGHYLRCKAVAAPPKPRPPCHNTPLVATAEVDDALRDTH